MKHGTTAGYKKGCRCEECRAAKSESNRKYREQAKPDLIARRLRQGGHSHGTTTLYRYGCRCEDCRAARSAEHLRIRELKLVDAAPYKAMIDEMLACGLTKSRIGYAMGYARNRSDALTHNKIDSYYHRHITPENARKIERVHWAMWIYRGDLREICKCEIPEEVRRQVFEEAS